MPSFDAIVGLSTRGLIPASYIAIRRRPAEAVLALQMMQALVPFTSIDFSSNQNGSSNLPWAVVTGFGIT